MSSFYTPPNVRGTDKQIQYNEDGVLSASSDLTWDDSAKELGVGGDINLDDGGTYSTTLQMVTPTANRTISFPDATGTVALVAGSSGQLTYNSAGANAGASTLTYDGSILTSSGRFINSYNATASSPAKTFTGSWFTGGTATTTKPQLLIEPTGTTSTAWSTSGTGLGVNAASGFAGRLLDLQTNGTSRMVVQGDGKLLVGTSSARNNVAGIAPGIQLEGANNNTPRSFGQIYGKSDAAGPLFLFAKHRSDSIGGQTVVSSSDELGQIVFTGSDGTNFVQGASIKGEVDGTPGANDMPGRIVLSTTADGESTPTERMRITRTGAILLGCTSAPNPGAVSTSNGWAINGTGATAYVTAKRDDNPIGYFRRDGTDGQVFLFYKGNAAVGSIGVTASATAYNTSSDYRLKENVVPLTGAANRLNQLQVHRFNFIADPDTTVDGFLAHEAQAVVPEAITGEKDAVDDEGNPVYQGIDQSKLVPLLTAALQEALQKIETLEQRLANAGIA